MSEPKQRAAGYIRVSSIGQTENESLPSQRKAIQEICDNRNYLLTKIYADEGISGSTVEERKDLINALQDARHGKYDVLIVWDITRFGRNLRDTLENYETLKEVGVKLYSLKEGGDFDNPSGKLKLSTMGMIAEYESEKIKERMVGGRIAKAQRGIPTNGTLPFGRTFDKETGKWGIDQTKKKAIEWVADQYLKNESLQSLAQQVKKRFGFSITYPYICTVLKQHCDDKWEINFEELVEPIHYEIPRLLPETKIQAVKDRLAHNRTNNRTDTKDYLLTGFIRCMHCGKTLIGQTQRSKHKKYEYYVHQGMKSETCRKFTTVPLKKVEHAIIQTIFENIYDAPSFEQAIKESLPDEKHIEKLKTEIEDKEVRLKEIKKKRKRLLQAVLNDILDEDDDLTKKSSKELKETEEKLKDEIDESINSLINLPDPEEIRKEAHRIRMKLKRKYQSQEHLQNMSFKDKKMLLHFLFDGKAPNGDHYGIYIDKRGKGKQMEIDYMMFGRLTGLRTIKGGDNDYFPNDDNSSDDNNNNPEDNGWTIIEPQESGKEDKFVEIDGIKRRRKSLKKSRSTHKNSGYKTNNFASSQK